MGRAKPRPRRFYSIPTGNATGNLGQSGQIHPQKKFCFFVKLGVDNWRISCYIKQVDSDKDNYTWGYSSAGRALEWHSRGQRFDPAYLHQKQRTAFWLSFVFDEIGAGEPFRSNTRFFLHGSGGFSVRKSSAAKKPKCMTAQPPYPAYLHQTVIRKARFLLSHKLTNPGNSDNL